MKQFVLENSGDPAVGIGVCLASRYGCTVCLDGRPVEHWLVDPGGSWYGFTWETAVPTDGKVTIRVEGDDDATMPDVAWMGELGGAVPAGSGVQWRESSAARGTRLIRFADEHDPVGERVKFRAFFREYERRTTSSGEAGARRRITDAVSVLWSNCLHRGESAHPEAAAAALADNIVELKAPAVTFLSRLQIELIEDHFPDEVAPFDLESVERAFEDFASGELARAGSVFGRTRLREADSANFFLWAEFAFAAIAYGVEEAAEWRLLLNVLVRTQMIFYKRYRKDSSTRTINDYEPPPKPLRGDDPDENLRLLKEQLRAKFKDLDKRDLAEAAARNARFAFYDDTKPRFP